MMLIQPSRAWVVRPVMPCAAAVPGDPERPSRVSRAEGDNERSGALQEVAAREPGRLVGGARVRRQVGRHAVLPSA